MLSVLVCARLRHSLTAVLTFCMVGASASVSAGSETMSIRVPSGTPEPLYFVSSQVAKAFAETGGEVSCFSKPA